MEIPPKHAAQYEMLRTEITSLVGETRKLEFATAAGLAGLYAWLANNGISSAMSLLGTPLVLLAAMRSYTLFKRIEFVAGYLRLIEEKYFKDEGNLIGYERYFDKNINRRKSNGSSRISGTSVVFWLVLLATALVVPHFLKPTPKKDDASGKPPTPQGLAPSSN